MQDNNYLTKEQQFYRCGREDMKNMILDILKQNKELESVSYDGKMIYKIYGNVIDKIKKL